MLLSLGVGVPHLQKMIRKNSQLAVQSLPAPLAPSEAVRTSSPVERSDLKGENKLEKDDEIKSQMKKKGWRHLREENPQQLLLLVRIVLSLVRRKLELTVTLFQLFQVGVHLQEVDEDQEWRR